jgi:hypothetical protein
MENKKFLLKKLLFIFVPFVLLFPQTSVARTCPVNITDALATGPVPNVDPPAAPSTPELDIASVHQFVLDNQITTLHDLLSVMPEHMKKHYALLEKTRGLNTASSTAPGIMMYSVDGTFLMNIGVDPNHELYEVVDMAYLQDEDAGNRNGDWQFASIDFRQNPPALVDNTNTDSNSVCFDCHGNPAKNQPPLPIRGRYLEWNDVIGDIKGQASEDLEASEITVLEQIKAIQATHDRYHAIVFDNRELTAGNTLVLPDLDYPYSLTNASMEIGTALVSSLAKRMKKNPAYFELREELLLAGFCQSKNQLENSDRDLIKQVLADYGVTIGSENLHQKHVYQALGLNFEHEMARHLKSDGTEPFKPGDDSFNFVSGDFDEVIQGYILRELAHEKPELKSILDSIPDIDTYAPCDKAWGNLSDHLDYRHHQLFVLKGTARQAARENYFESSNFRYSQGIFDPSKVQVCNYLKANMEAPGSPDQDGDGVVDNLDNCSTISNSNQRDTDNDGFGNLCDADLDNNGSVSFADLNLFRTRFGTADPNADFDGNGSVSFTDLDIFRSLFGQAPGPAGDL